eukprot:30830-Pelagococcus_subviridis.AAC.4
MLPVHAAPLPDVLLRARVRDLRELAHVVQRPGFWYGVRRRFDVSQDALVVALLRAVQLLRALPSEPARDERRRELVRGQVVRVDPARERVARV